jgi:hypothetical protein
MHGPPTPHSDVKPNQLNDDGVCDGCALRIIERDDRFTDFTACAAEETGGQIVIPRIDVMI